MKKIMCLMILGIITFLGYSEVTDLEGMTDTGILGFLLQSIPGIGGMAGIAIALILKTGIITWGVQWIGRKILAKFGTKWGPNGPNTFWKILGFFFGKIIYIKNATVNSKLDPVLFRVAELRLQESIKKYIGKSTNSVKVEAVSNAVKEKMKDLIDKQYPSILDEKK